MATPITHRRIIKGLIDFGYKNVSKKGSCHGLAMMSIQAFLISREALSTFRDRLDDIVDHPHISKDIQPILAKKPDQLTQNEIKLKETYFNIWAFFDGVRLHHSPEMFRKIFGKSLSQGHFSEIAKATHPVATPSIKKIGGSIGLYTLDEMTNYITALRESLEKTKLEKSKLKMSFLLGSPHHVIQISYDANAEQWILFDSNQEGFFDSRKTTVHNDRSVAKWIIQHCYGLSAKYMSEIENIKEQSNKLFPISLDAICAAENENVLTETFYNVTQSTFYQTIHHSLTDKIEYEKNKKQ